MPPLLHGAADRREWSVATLAIVTAVLVLGCGGPQVDIREALEIADVTTGWLDVGIAEGGKNKLVPTVSFRLKNVSPQPVDTVQINGVFKRAQEEDEWGTAFVRVIGSEGLDPGNSTKPIVLQSQLGYTGEQPRAEMLRHSQFIDARVELFVKRGSEQWVKLGERPIDRQLLTQSRLDLPEKLDSILEKQEKILEKLEK